MTEATLSITNPDEILALFGPRDQHLRKLRRLFDVSITQRDGSIRISGDGEGVLRRTAGAGRVGVVDERPVRAERSGERLLGIVGTIGFGASPIVFDSGIEQLGQEGSVRVVDCHDGITRVWRGLRGHE